MIGTLSEALTVGGVEYPIRTDYRNVLRMFEAIQDPELDQTEKGIVTIYMMFEDFSNADDVLNAAAAGFDLEEAVRQIEWFISAGAPEKGNAGPPTYSWKQDEQMIFSDINKIAGKEVREMECLHWWTFLGYFNGIGEGTFLYIVGIRDKLNKGKKLEKHEREFLAHNPELVVIKKPKTKEEQAQEDEYQALLDEVIG